jgi:hypothetical protein
VNSFEQIQNKLEAFIRKYYLNDLIKGVILFFATGLLYFVITLFIEYMLWLSSTGRTMLFWLFVMVEVALLTKFILIPLTKLFKLQRGIDYKEASQIIGTHFSEVNDKLLNVLQLKDDSKESELLLASIEQKSLELTPIPFKLAVNFKSNIKYLKYAAIPLLIIAVSFISGKYNWFSDSYERVVNYQTAYEPPAPFSFFIINEELKTIEGRDFTLTVKTEGEITPENAQINYNNESYYLKSSGDGAFEFTFTQPREDVQFNLSANGVQSEYHNLEIINTPSLLGFDMVLDYPNYTKKQDETLKSNGNAIVPLGTKVSWKVRTKNTDKVELNSIDSTYNFQENGNSFELSQRLFKSLDYTLNTSNSSLADFESLSFSIKVIRDEFPEINVKTEQDSLDSQTLYFYGQISDDYGLSKLRLVYYPSGDEEGKQMENINISTSNFDEFVSVFPDQLNLQEGVSYDLYFEVFDNDAIANYKGTKSNVFSFRKLTEEELEEEQLKEQGETIDDLNDSLEKMDKQEVELKEFSKTQKEKSELNFNDKKKLENFLKRQKQQDELMKNFNEKLKENLEEFQNEKEDPFKESLQQRLEENQKQLELDEELLKELEKLSEKIQKEELSQKLEELAKQNKNKKRSLQQLLELTKRYYVSMKSEKLRVELEELSKEQEALSKEDSEKNTKEKQDQLNKKFEDIKEELEELRKENQSLMEPMDVPNDTKKEEDIKKEQQEASDNLEKKEQSSDQQNKQQQQQKAKKNQKKATEKMRQLSEQMQQSMMNGSAEQMSEDMDMLRQVLDNLVVYSFDQEDLMNRFKGIQINHNEYAKYLINQQSLREHFEHVDDSLFALSLRQPMISERINKEVTEVFFNIDKSLEQLADNRLYQGVAAQQYAVTSTNSLANLLSDMLDNMQSQMNPSPGQGQGDMQLPDIIMSQEELNKQMQEGLKKSQEGKPQEGKEGKEQQGEGEQQQEGGEGQNEEMNGELYQIYQQQQELRKALEYKLGKEGKQGSGSNLLREMENIERDLLNKGFTNRTLQRMSNLKHQLLKLENATFQQGEDNKRKSKTNTREFGVLSSEQLNSVKRYFNTTEVLNRQTLPLQQHYKRKVQEYFKKTNDQL